MNEPLLYAGDRHGSYAFYLSCLHKEIDAAFARIERGELASIQRMPSYRPFFCGAFVSWPGEEANLTPTNCTYPTMFWPDHDGFVNDPARGDA